jgi:hypothetical protein
MYCKTKISLKSEKSDSKLKPDHHFQSDSTGSLKLCHRQRLPTPTYALNNDKFIRYIHIKRVLCSTHVAKENLKNLRFGRWFLKAGTLRNSCTFPLAE